MMQLSLMLVALAAGFASASPRQLYAPQCCAADRCFEAAQLPPKYTPIASKFCAQYIHSTPGASTKLATATTTTTITPARVTVTQTQTSVTTAISTVPSVCTTGTAVTYTTEVFYPTRGAAGQKRGLGYAPAIPIPGPLSAGCKHNSLPQAVSSACRCFLKPHTTTMTSTSTVTVTAPTVVPTTTTSVFLSIVSSATTVCTTTVTTTSSNGQLSCGPGAAQPTALASGSVSCTSAPPPGETIGLLRIEGGSEGTVFEGCVSSSGRTITTPSGGSHECDGTNNDANASPGATCTTQLDEAADEAAFAYDGTYSAQYQDYFITSIDTTAQTSTMFWGLLQDLSFAQVGGCEQEIAPGGTQETLWAFDAFSVNSFLKIDPEYMVVPVGTSSVTVTVSQTNGEGAAFSPATGASIQGGTTSDNSGHSSISVPTAPGCYQYKATRSGALRSNAFYLSVY